MSSLITRELLDRISDLENEVLKWKKQALDNRGVGFSFEQYIADLIGGTVLNNSNCGYDIRSKSGKRIEVKYSNLTPPKKGSPTLRWMWYNIFGGDNSSKDFDFILLAGAADPRYNPRRTYNFFILTMEELMSIAYINKTSKRSGAACISMTTNPKTVNCHAGKFLLAKGFKACEIAEVLNG